jgi:hypothetical protein
MRETLNILKSLSLLGIVEEYSRCRKEGKKEGMNIEIILPGLL